MELDIGKKLKELRKERKLSILKLAELSEVSTGLISQIERGKVVPSVVSMWKLAKALNVNIGFFFDEETSDGDIAEEDFVIRRGEHKVIIMDKGRMVYELFTPEGEHSIDFMKIILRKGETLDRAKITKNLVTHEGEEGGYVLSGTLTVCIDTNTYELHEGDSIYFSSRLPHKYLNYGEEDCVTIWAMTPLFF